MVSVGQDTSNHDARQAAPALVAKICEQVYAWRQKDYEGASATSVSLLRWWFETEHLVENADGSLSSFRYLPFHSDLMALIPLNRSLPFPGYPSPSL